MAKSWECSLPAAYATSSDASVEAGADAGAGCPSEPGDVTVTCSVLCE
jgi:hypothetical protein